MAYVRAALLGLVILIFLLVIPLQWLVLRLAPYARHWLPMLFHHALCVVTGLRVTVSGALPANVALMLVANHVSWLDIPALGSVVPVSFLAKKEVGKWPIIGAFARLQGCLFVDRNRKRGIPLVNQQITASLAQGNGVVLFAEATTGDGNRLMKFHSPHFQAAIAAAGAGAAAVVPVALVYTCRNGLPYDLLNKPDIAWYGDMALLPHLWGILRGGPVDCSIHLGAAVTVTVKDNRKNLALAMQQLIRGEIGRHRRDA